MSPERNISGKDLSKVITSEDILGKDVIDSDGRFIGVVDKVLIDPRLFDFVGISLDKGFLRRGLSIGKNYIQKITDHAVFLKIRVAYELKGMAVFDKDGKRIGKVVALELAGHTNKITHLIISTPLASLIREFTIPFKHVKNIGENIILAITKEAIAVQHELKEKLKLEKQLSQ